MSVSSIERNILIFHKQEKHKKDSRLTCKHCGHHYLRKDNLEAHVRSAHPADTSSEAGSDVIKCQLCGKTYGTRSNLTDHMRICHGILPWNNVPKNGEEVDLDRLELELAGSVQVWNVVVNLLKLFSYFSFLKQYSKPECGIFISKFSRIIQSLQFF